eukprot:Hpha_TRINITY_DN9853_c0_g1::TRINITY_DN9853_c0_g1_i1::g.81411::m.81411
MSRRPTFAGRQTRSASHSRASHSRTVEVRSPPRSVKRADVADAFMLGEAGTPANPLADIMHDERSMQGGPVAYEVERYRGLQQQLRYVGVGDPGEVSDDRIVVHTVDEPAKYQFKYVEDKGNRSTALALPKPTTEETMANAARRCMVRKDLPETMHTEPDFVQERYLHYLKDFDQQRLYSRLGAKSEANELLSRDTRTANESTRKALEAEILNWAARQDVGDNTEDYGDRHLEVAQEEADAMRGKDVVHDRVHFVRVTADEIERIIGVAFKKLEATHRKDWLPRGSPQMRATKKTQTTLTLVRDSPGLCDSADLDSPSGMASGVMGAEDLQPLSRMLEMDAVVRKKNTHLTNVMGTCEVYRNKLREKDLLHRAEAYLQDVALKRALAENQALATGPGFTTDWDESACTQKMPDEFSVEEVMGVLREEVRDHGEQDRRLIREQQEEIGKLKQEIEMLKLESERKFGSLEAALKEVTEEKEELDRELKDREEIISWRDERIKAQIDEIDGLHHQVRHYEEKELKLEARVKEAEANLHAAEEQMATMVTREEMEKAIETQKKKSETVRRLKDAEIMTHKKRATELDQRLTKATADMTSMRSQLRDVQSELISAREASQTVSAHFIRDLAAVFTHLQSVRESVNAFSTIADLRTAVWKATDDVLDYFGDAMAEGKAHLQSAQLERHMRRQCDIEFRPPEDVIGQKLIAVQEEAAKLKGQITELEGVHAKVKEGDRTWRLRLDVFKQYARSGLRILEQLCEMSTEKKVRELNMIELSTVLEDHQDATQRDIRSIWGTEISLFGKVHRAVQADKAMSLRTEKELSRANHQLSRAEHSLGMHKSVVTKVVIEDKTELRALSQSLRREVLTVATDAVRKARGGLPPEIEQLNVQDKHLAAQAGRIAMRRVKVRARNTVRNRVLGDRVKQAEHAKGRKGIEEEAEDEAEERRHEEITGRLFAVLATVQSTRDTEDVVIQRVKNVTERLVHCVTALRDDVLRLQDLQDSSGDVELGVLAELTAERAEGADKEDKIERLTDALAAAEARAQAAELQLEQGSFRRGKGSRTFSGALPRKNSGLRKRSSVASQRSSETPASPVSPTGGGPGANEPPQLLSSPGYPQPKEADWTKEVSEAGDEEYGSAGASELEMIKREMRTQTEWEQLWRVELVRRIHALERQLGKPESDPDSYHPDPAQRPGATGGPMMLLKRRKSSVRQALTRNAYVQTESDSSVLRFTHVASALRAKLKGLKSRPPDLTGAAAMAHGTRAFDPRGDMVDRITLAPHVVNVGEDSADDQSSPRSPSPQRRFSPPRKGSKPPSPEPSSAGPFGVILPEEQGPSWADIHRTNQEAVPLDQLVHQRHAAAAAARRPGSGKRLRVSRLSIGLPPPPGDVAVASVTTQQHPSYTRGGGWLPPEIVQAASSAGIQPRKLFQAYTEGLRAPIGSDVPNKYYSQLVGQGEGETEQARKRKEILEKAWSWGQQTVARFVATCSRPTSARGPSIDGPSSPTDPDSRQLMIAPTSPPIPGSPTAVGIGDGPLGTPRPRDGPVSVLRTATLMTPDALARLLKPGRACGLCNTAASPTLAAWAVVAAADWVSGVVVLRLAMPSDEGTSRLPFRGTRPNSAGCVGQLRSLPVPVSDDAPSPSKWRLPSPFHTAVQRYQRSANELLSLRDAAIPPPLASARSRQSGGYSARGTQLQLPSLPGTPRQVGAVPQVNIPPRFVAPVRTRAHAGSESDEEGVEDCVLRQRAETNERTRGRRRRSSSPPESRDFYIGGRTARRTPLAPLLLVAREAALLADSLRECSPVRRRPILVKTVVSATVVAACIVAATSTKRSRALPSGPRVGSASSKPRPKHRLGSLAL